MAKLNGGGEAEPNANFTALGCDHWDVTTGDAGNQIPSQRLGFIFIYTRQIMIAIIDYQMGNLRSVQKAFERVGHSATITSDAGEVAAASHVVLPGVGAFADAIRELRQRGLDQVVKETIDSGKPFLGICLGLQMLFDVSYEDGEHEGLGIVPGEVKRFTPTDHALKVPHMGWNEVRKANAECPLLEGTPDGTHFYFVHSYYVAPTDHDVVALEANYPDPFCAMIWRDNLYATQFHPEKSQSKGLELLGRFAQLAGAHAV